MAFYGIQRQHTLELTLEGTGKSPTGPSITTPTGCLKFDELVIGGGADSPVTYDTNSGIFTIVSGENYLVSWFVTVRTGLEDPGVKFSLYTEQYNGGIVVPNSPKLYPSTNSMKTGQLSGSAILQLTQGHTCKFGLFNTGSGPVSLAYYTDLEEVNANITIIPYVAGGYSTSYGLIGMSLTLSKASTVTQIDGNAPVIFDTRAPGYETHFDYNTTTGVITVIKPGNFVVYWSVNLDGSEDTRFISFTLLSGNGVALAVCESTLLMQQSYSGFAFITVTADDNTFRLVNTCKLYSDQTKYAALTYTSLTDKATLRIIGHS